MKTALVFFLISSAALAEGLRCRLNCPGHQEEFVEDSLFRLGRCEYRPEKVHDHPEAIVPEINVRLRRKSCMGKAELPVEIQLTLREVWPGNKPVVRLGFEPGTRDCPCLVSVFRLARFRNIIHAAALTPP